jgi:hypothetical protein
MFCGMLPNIRKSTALFKGSWALPICPSDKNSIKIKVVWSIDGMILTGETEVLGEKHYIVWVVGE